MKEKERVCFLKLEELLEGLARTGDSPAGSIPDKYRAGYLEEGKEVLEELMGYIADRENWERQLMRNAQEL